MATGSDGGRPLVVVGVDGSDESVAALGWAVRYAAVTGGTVRAVLVWHYPAAAGVVPAVPAPAEVTDEVEQQFRASLTAAVEKVSAQSPAVPIEPVLRYGHPAQVLAEESKHADLLVVGRRGHGAFVGMLLGSVSQHCVATAACPVVVVQGRLSG
jgi:nucleotide-binding universal stress UspA family protein